MNIEDHVKHWGEEIEGQFDYVASCGKTTGVIANWPHNVNCPECQNIMAKVDEKVFKKYGDPNPEHSFAMKFA